MTERGEEMGIPGHSAAHHFPTSSSEPPETRSRRDPNLHPPHHHHDDDYQDPTRSSDPEHPPAPNNDHHHHHFRSRFRPPASDAVATTSAGPPAPAVRYRECMRNHAASSGRHVVDGCGEFMPAGDDGTPDALRCAACDCHRSFHRQEFHGNPAPPPQLMLPHPSRYGGSTSTSTRSRNHHSLSFPPQALPPPATQHHALPPLPVAMMSFGGGGEESSSEDVDVSQPNDLPHAEALQQSATTSYSRKRFRTRFTQEQKDSMAEFAERIGWRIQKQDEPEVDHFCSQIGVKRKVFKVWMHNNKQPLMKQRKQT